MEEKISCDCTVIHEDVIIKVRGRLPSNGEFLATANLFKIFGDKTRLQILSALNVSEMCVCDISALMGMTKSAISHQLGLLRENNLVKHRREGKVIYYSLADSHVKTIIEMGREHINE